MTSKELDRIVLQKAIEKLVADNDALHQKLIKAERKAAKYRNLLCKRRSK